MQSYSIYKVHAYKIGR